MGSIDERTGAAEGDLESAQLRQRSEKIDVRAFHIGEFESGERRHNRQCFV